ncbi:alpha/beta fold hydrolase [Actinokineospora sp.]|uniref:alpha/beta fold hydrolase n=1 Tax=Actinokineospora sp. TaxID=1872133 RepID=UPI0040384316
MTSTTTAPTRFTYPARDGLDIVAYRWDPEGPARGIVQLTHGMGEHVLRYAHLAGALTAAGFVVYGQDHRGHGATAPSEDALGQIGPTGWSELVNDIDLLVTHARGEHPDLPLVLAGHSMGSFAMQQYLLDHSGHVDAVALTGTASIDLLEPALNLDEPIELSAFNAPFAPARTEFDWLSRDESQVDAYLADPYCGRGLDMTSGKAMFAGARALADPERMAAIRSDLPVYIAVGEADPVNGQLALVHALLGRLAAAGISDVTLHTYPGARHEILNETNRDEVEADLLTWLDRVVPVAH